LHPLLGRIRQLLTSRRLHAFEIVRNRFADRFAGMMAGLKVAALFEFFFRFPESLLERLVAFQ